MSQWDLAKDSANSHDVLCPGPCLEPVGRTLWKLAEGSTTAGMVVASMMAVDDGDVKESVLGRIPEQALGPCSGGALSRSWPCSGDALGGY